MGKYKRLTTYPSVIDVEREINLITQSRIIGC